AGEDSMFYDVYALKKGGQLLFHKNINDNEISSLDSDLISGFFAAIFTFASCYTKKTLESIKLEVIKLVFIEHENFIFSALVDVFEPDTEVKKKLRQIATSFIRKYNDELKEWNYDRCQFLDFDNEIAEIIMKG
ncbi:MAG: hypothetical protein ACTSRW_17065, partial [Candidatus Helarchaeota archaeon]